MKPCHPIWKIAHTVVATVCMIGTVAVLLRVTADSFDATELQALGGSAVLVPLVLAAIRVVSDRLTSTRNGD